MGNRKPIKTKRCEIVEYWFNRIDESDFSVDASEAHERCWRCGSETKLERCHIIPDSLGGADEPANFVLLCKRCHLENPNVKDETIMWDWLKAYKSIFYDTFWSLEGMKEYNYIYGKSIQEEKRERWGETSIEIEEQLQKMLHKQIKKCTYHFGHPYLNRATIAGIYRMFFRDWDNSQKNVETKDEKAKI